MNTHRPSPEGADVDLHFGPFTLNMRRHVLRKYGRIVGLGKISLKLLAALASRPGDVIEKRELIALAWGGRPTSEGNLRAQILRLRRVIEDTSGPSAQIRSVPGRGYRFTPVAWRVAQAPPPTGSGPVLTVCKDTVADVFNALNQGRLVTLTGPGGIGKSTVATTVMSESTGRGWQTCRVDLTLPPLTSGAYARLEHSLGLRDGEANVLPYVDSHVHLVIVDNCEHALEEASHLATTLLTQTRCKVLTTSREPLDMEGEMLLRVNALLSPPAGTCSLQHALTFSAFRLLTERLRKAHPGVLIKESDVAPLSHLCRTLEGLPLALEIAAIHASVNAGALTHIPDVPGLLDAPDHSQRLTRHRSLAASLEWSLNALPDADYELFTKLAIYAHGFTLATARSLECILQTPSTSVEEIIWRLIRRSLLSIVQHSEPKRYEMSPWARQYALAKLARSEDWHKVVANHCGYALEVLEEVSAKLCDEPSQAWQARYGAEADVVRSALQMCCSESGNRLLGADMCLAILGLTSES